MVALVALAVAGASPALAKNPYPQQLCEIPPVNTGPPYAQSPRVRVDKVNGRDVIVLLPPGYATSHADYPVLYFFHGVISRPDCLFTKTDLLEFTAGQPTDKQAIVVMPDGGPGAVYLDTRDGKFHDETFFMTKGIPFIDGRYRTRANRANRVVAGLSAGGFAAFHLAARYPDRFVAAGSFSGFIDFDESNPVVLAIAGGVGLAAEGTSAQPSADPYAPLGNPVTDSIWWHNINPTSLAPSFHGMSVYFASGNGQPCDLTDLTDIRRGAGTLLPFSQGEPIIHDMADKFRAALVADRVPHFYDDYGCGLHTYRYAERDMHVFWPRLFRAVGSPPPPSFDYRRADPNFSIWGWSGFGSGGSATSAVTDPSAIALQPADGKIVVAGDAQEPGTAAGSLSFDFALARFLK
jgi:S-formylglutathione hydrolase FrmB